MLRVFCLKDIKPLFDNLRVGFTSTQRVIGTVHDSFDCFDDGHLITRPCDRIALCLVCDGFHHFLIPRDLMRNAIKNGSEMFLLREKGIHL